MGAAIADARFGSDDRLLIGCVVGSLLLHALVVLYVPRVLPHGEPLRAMTATIREVAPQPVLPKGERTVPLVKFRSPEEKKAATPPVKAAAAGEGDPDLFDHLRAVRKRLADEHQVPAYVIFSDKTLKDMAAKVPHTSAEFRQVMGVGEAKLEAYGSIFLREIGEWEGARGSESARG